MRLVQFLGAALLCTSLSLTACLEKAKDVVVKCDSPEECSDAQWDQLFDQAVSELEAEGHAMTHETLSEQDVYWMLFDRMVSLATDGSETAQLSSYVWASYDSTIEYCGPGHTDAGGSAFFPLPDDCLNRACHTHDCCYDSIEEGRNRLCGWSTGTKYCDDEFFSSYEQCKEAGECGVKCRIIGGIARGLTNLPRFGTCSECTSLPDVDACSSLGAECGETINGCGEAIACGSCTSPQTCGHTVPNRCGPKLSGDPCKDGVDCSTPNSICWNDTCLQEGQFRITLGWTADTDFDLHVLTPSGSEISWSQESADGGVLDIDDCYDECKNSNGTHVENVFFEDTPPTGSYEVWVENYDGRDGGSFEIEVAGPKAGDAAQTFAGSLPATADASSMRYSFTLDFQASGHDLGFALASCWNVGNDSDSDGLNDDCEYDVAYAFRPRLLFGPGSYDNTRTTYWAAYKISGQDVITVFYALSYHMDGGDPPLGLNSHHGDSEFIVLYITNTAGNVWELSNAFYSAHWDTLCDSSEYLSYPDLSYYDVYRGRPYVYVAESKHGNFKDITSCEGGCVWTDYCDTDWDNFVGQINVDVYSSRNLGSASVPLLGYSGSPVIINNNYEWYWHNERFCGWQVSGNPGDRSNCTGIDNSYYRQLTNWISGTLTNPQ